MAYPLEIEWYERTREQIASCRKSGYRAALSTKPENNWILSEASLTKEDPQPWELMLRTWMNAFQQAASSAERQLAGYRFIIQLLQSNIPCQSLDLRQIALTQEDPQKKADLQDFLQWVGAYWPLQAIHLHPDDGGIPNEVQQVFREHQFLHHALDIKLSMNWFYLVPYLEDIIQQAFLTSCWLLDRAGTLMTGRTSTFVTKVGDWPMDETILLKIEQWPQLLNRFKEFGKPAQLAAASESLLELEPIETEESKEWLFFQREILVAFTTLHITVQEKMRRILQTLQTPQETWLNEPWFLSLNAYIALYQSYENGHQSLLRLSPSSLAEYQPIKQRSSSIEPKGLFSFSTLFATKSVCHISNPLPYESLPETYQAMLTLRIQSDTSAILPPFNGIMPELMTQWENHDIPQKACLSHQEQYAILQTLTCPNVGRLSAEHLSLSAEGQVNFWFFVEQLLTYNPHIAEIKIPADWGDVPQNINDMFHKNRQWRAALYYASLPKADYDALSFSTDLLDVKKYRKNLAMEYANTASPWIKNTLKNLKSSLPESDFNSLKKAFEENYLPIITAMSSQKETPAILLPIRYDNAFKACQPRERDLTFQAQIRVDSLGFH